MDKNIEWEAHHFRLSLMTQAYCGPDIEQGSSLSRVWQLTQTATLVGISACRGVDKDASDEQRAAQDRVNKSNTAKLSNMIREANYGFIPMVGRYVENEGTPNAKAVVEKSFLISVGGGDKEAKNLLAFAKKAAAFFEQDSILYKPFDTTKASLVYTWGPNKGKVESIGEWHPNKIGFYFSELVNRRQTFSFGDPTNMEDLPVDYRKYMTTNPTAFKIVEDLNLIVKGKLKDKTSLKAALDFHYLTEEDRAVLYRFLGNSPKSTDFVQLQAIANKIAKHK